MEHHRKTWHEKHDETLTLAQHAADRIARIVGSWTYIGVQTFLVTIWVSLNIYGYIYRWDPYPFILLNLCLSLLATYTAPIIMMSQNRQGERDRLQAEEDYRTNVEAKEEIEEIQRRLARLEIEKLDRIIALLEKR